MISLFSGLIPGMELMMHSPLRVRKDAKGFTLPEVILVCVIIGVTAAIAIPRFASWLPSYRLHSAAKDLLANFQLAKINAVRRNANCTVSFNLAIGGKPWDYVISVDFDNNEIYDSGETILVKKQWKDYRDVFFDTSHGIDNSGIDFANTPPSVAFYPNGLPSAGGTVYLKNTKGKTVRVALSEAGNLQID